MKTKLESFETYRGFAALMIAAIHFKVNSPLVNHVFANGFFVHFFFTLSGFVMYLNYRDRISSIKTMLNFLKKRFLRLYPLHVLFLFIFLCIEIFKYLLEINYNIVANNKAFSINNLESLIGNLFLFQTFFDYNSFNTPSWSISAEYYTYILFAVVLIFFPKRLLLIILFLVCIVFFRIYSDVGFGINYTFHSFLDCVYCFFIGLLSCKLYFKFSNNDFYKINYQIFCFIFLLLSIISMIYFKDEYQYLLPFIFGILLFFSARLNKNDFIGKFICNKYFVYLGTISYSVYMCHLFVFWSLTQIYRFIFKVNTTKDIEGVIKIDLNLFQSNLMIIISYILTIVCSHILYKYFETKFYKPK